MNRLLFTKIMFTLDEFETITKKKIKKFRYDEGILYITTYDKIIHRITIEEVDNKEE